MNRRIAFVTSVNSRKAGGLFFTISSVVNKLVIDPKNTVAVVGFYDEFSDRDLIVYDKKVKLIEYSVNSLFKKIGFSFDLREKLSSFSPQIIHQQGIWLYYSKEVLNLKLKKNVKVIIQPHGMLDYWAINNSKVKKKVIGCLYENSNLRNADCIHALNFEEYKAIRSFGLKQPVAIIPNGIDIPSLLSSSITTTENKSDEDQNGKKKLLYLGRIHPKKGIELLVDAVSEIVRTESENGLKNWIIQIAGWDQDSHEQYLMDRIEKMFLTDHFEFLGPVFNDQKEKVFLAADAFILPSYSEGLPMTILEAWSYKLPVLMTKFCNLPDGFKANAALELETDAKNIANKLLVLFNMSEKERKEVGENGFKLVSEKYTWEKVAKQTEELYQWLDGELIDSPSFIYKD